LGFLGVLFKDLGTKGFRGRKRALKRTSIEPKKRPEKRPIFDVFQKSPFKLCLIVAKIEKSAKKGLNSRFFGLFGVFCPKRPKSVENDAFWAFWALFGVLPGNSLVKRHKVRKQRLIYTFLDIGVCF